MFNWMHVPVWVLIEEYFHEQCPILNVSKTFNHRLFKCFKLCFSYLYCLYIIYIMIILLQFRLKEFVGWYASGSDELVITEYPAKYQAGHRILSRHISGLRYTVAWIFVSSLISGAMQYATVVSNKLVRLWIIMVQ